MQLTLCKQIARFAHILQSELFPALDTDALPLTAEHKRLVAALTMIRLERFIPPQYGWIGRPSKDRCCIARAFLAKAVLNLPTTRNLLHRLAADRKLMQLCGWTDRRHIPHESTFSRAFEEFAQMQLAEVVHEALIRETHSQRIVGHISRDSSKIPAHEAFPETPSEKRAQQAPDLSQGKKKKVSAKGRKLGRKLRKRDRTAASRDTRIERQKQMKTAREMLEEIPRECSIGVQVTKKREPKFTKGYKLHLDVADGQIPVSAVLSSANVHDSQLSVPLTKITSERITYLYELMDSAYDAVAIREYSHQHGHVAIIAPKAPQNQRTQLPSRRMVPRQLSPAERIRFRQRTTVERVFSRMKGEFGALNVRVRGPVKVMAHLMFGILALTADQLLRLAG
jgi:hypothetical protein